MDFLRETYYQNPGLYNCIMGLLIFGGLGRAYSGESDHPFRFKVITDSDSM